MCFGIESMKIDLADPTSVALLAASAFEAAGIDHALYGGLLLAAYGRPRETRDADLAVLDVSAAAARDALVSSDLDASVSFERVRFGGLTVTRIALVGGDALNTVDLVRPVSDRYARAVLDRSLRAPLRGRSITVVTPEDFVVLKALSTRDSDLADAASVVASCGAALDVTLIEQEVGRLESEVRDAAVAARWSAIRDRSRSSDPR
jgi:predicted nucleotidyltransferase